MPIEPWWEINPAATPRQELGMVSPELARRLGAGSSVAWVQPTNPHANGRGSPVGFTTNSGDFLALCRVIVFFKDDS